jgi:hypothetical protein
MGKKIHIDVGAKHALPLSFKEQDEKKGVCVGSTKR